MNKKLRSLIIIFLFIITVSPAILHAQATRVWVSEYGDNANPCSRTAPCRTFAGAITKVAAGGEISVLDHGEFGALSITKSIIISGDGVLAGITTTGNGISINGNNIAVTLRNLSLLFTGTGNTASGINYINGSTVTIENCTIQNFPTGIKAGLSADGLLTVKNTNVRSTFQGSVGISVNTSAGLIKANIDRAELNDSIGVVASGNSVAVVSNSIISHCFVGIQAQNNGVASLQNCILNINDVAISVKDAESVVKLSTGSFFDNTTALRGAGKVFSAGNNCFAGSPFNLLMPLYIVEQQ